MLTPEEMQQMHNYYSKPNAIWPNGSIMDYTVLAHEYTRTCPKHILQLAQRYFTLRPCEEKITLLIQLMNYIEDYQKNKEGQ